MMRLRDFPAVLRRRSWLWEPAAIILVGLALLWLCAYLYTVVPEGTFLREIVVALLGAIITLLITGLVAVYALRQRIRSAMEKRKLKVLDPAAWQSPSIKVGEMVIPDMSVIVSCTLRSPWTDRATVQFARGGTRPRHELVEATRGLWLPEMQTKAEAGNYVLFDGVGVDIVSARQSARVVRGRENQPHFEFEVAPSQYFDFACANARLDQPFQLEGEDVPQSLRERWAIRPRSILDVGKLPAGAVAGSGTAVVTSDHRLVFGVREKTFIAGRSDSEDPRHLVHFVAEGLQPWDVDSEGDFSPRHGAYRALNEELHVSPRSDAIAGVESMVETGFSFDHKRWQPYFTFLARIGTSWDDLYTGFRTATDAWESDNLWSLPFDIEHRGVRLLLLDRHPEFLLASNHAKTVLWFSLLYEYGYHKLRDELTAPDA